MKNPAEGARAVVERARSGDQVAMAIIAQVRDQAKAGNVRAQHSKKLIEKYIKKVPSQIGAEASVNTNPAALQALWKAREQTPEQFATVVVKASPGVRLWEAVVAVVHGPRLSKENPLMQTVNIKGSRISDIVRRAFRIQCLQNPKCPIGAYCRVTGWELGE